MTEEKQKAAVNGSAGVNHIGINMHHAKSDRRYHKTVE